MAAADIDEYLAGVDDARRGTLDDLRRNILKALPPGAEQCMAYGMPAFKVQGKAVAGFGSFKDHLSYLPHSGSVLTVLEADFVGYRHTKGALHFPVDAPLPPMLVTKLVRARLDELGLGLGRR